jgi:hypothetical protein
MQSFILLSADLLSVVNLCAVFLIVLAPLSKVLAFFCDSVNASLKAHLHDGKNCAKLVGFKEQDKIFINCKTH